MTFLPKVHSNPHFILQAKENVCCNVCFRVHDKKHGRQTPEKDPGDYPIHRHHLRALLFCMLIALRFMWCYGCFMSAHLVCYGIHTPHEDIVTSFGDEVTMFVCDKCRNLSNFNHPVNTKQSHIMSHSLF